MPYIKQLTKVGSALALVIDRGLLDQLGLDPGNEVEIVLQGRSLVISAHRRTPGHDVERAAKRGLTTRRGLLARFRK